MADTGLPVILDANAGPTGLHASELSCTELLTGQPLPVDAHLLESLPWRKVNDFLAAVGGERTLEGFARALFREGGALVSFDSCHFGVADSRTLDEPLLMMTHPQGQGAGYQPYYMKVDPVRPSYPYTRRGIVTWSRHDGEFTRDFLSRYRIHHAMHIRNMKPEGGVGFTWNIQRSTRGFSEREMALYFVLRPHLHNLFSLIYTPEKARRDRVVAAAKAFGLTPREVQVAVLLCERLSDAEIAETLQVSRRTVHKHIEHVYQKLRVSSRRGLREETILALALEGH